MFLSHIVPSDEDGKEWHNFECASCAYAEMVSVKFG